MGAERDIELLYNKYCKLEENQQNILQTLNNGLKSTTTETAETVSNLAKKFNEMDKKISNKDAEKEGKVTMFKLIVAIVSGMGSGAITVLGALKYLGVI
jgi:hypothetical protein